MTASISKALSRPSQRRDSGGLRRRGRYEELADPKYTDTGGIFDIMAVTVIHENLRSSHLHRHQADVPIDVGDLERESLDLSVQHPST